MTPAEPSEKQVFADRARAVTHWAPRQPLERLRGRPTLRRSVDVRNGTARRKPGARTALHYCRANRGGTIANSQATGSRAVTR